MEDSKRKCPPAFLYASRAAGLDGWGLGMWFDLGPYSQNQRTRHTIEATAAGPPCGRYIDLILSLFILVFVQKKLSMGFTWRPNSVPHTVRWTLRPYVIERGGRAFIPGFQTFPTASFFLDVFVTYYSSPYYTFIWSNSVHTPSSLLASNISAQYYQTN